MVGGPAACLWRGAVRRTGGSFPICNGTVKKVPEVCADVTLWAAQSDGRRSRNQMPLKWFLQAHMGHTVKHMKGLLTAVVYFHVAYKHWLLTEHNFGPVCNGWIQIWVIFYFYFFAERGGGAGLFFFFFAGLLLVRELGTESILMLQAGVNQLLIPAESKHQSLVRYPQEELYTNLSETWHLTHAERETPSASSKPTTCRSV